MSDQRYMMRGVSASKEDVHNAIKNIDKGLYPKAFCKIIPDILGGDPEYCNIMHADGAGTKSSLAYLYWKETGDLSVWKGIAQDALSVDDFVKKSQFTYYTRDALSKVADKVSYFAKKEGLHAHAKSATIRFED